MIGIIVWLLLIIIIATLSNPASWIIDLTLIGIAIAFVFVLWLLAHFTEKRADKRTKEAHEEREKAIDEWERLHGRKHFTRMTQEEKDRWLKSKSRI